MMDWSSVVQGGLYTVPMAARILGAEPAKVRSWVEGYSHSDAQPILVRQVPRIGGRTVLGFLDLVESAFVRHFRGIGFSAQTLRRLAMRLRDRHNSNHPFAMNKRFRDDGKVIFEEVIEDSGEQRLLNLMNDNFEIAEIVAPSMFDRIFYVADLAATWKPLVGHDAIIINPKVSFGAPVVESCGVPTETLYKAFIADGVVDNIADEFEIAHVDVIAAINFERDLERRTAH